MVHVSAGGIPCLAPEAVLLFKAKHRRDKDEADFARALPKLDAAQRRWLAASQGPIPVMRGWMRYRLIRR